jgi:hypothetical protein
MTEFKKPCGLPSIDGVLNGTHVPIIKPIGQSCGDYYYH